MVMKVAALTMVIGLFLCGCSQVTIQYTPTVMPTGELTPYHTTTPKPITPTATFVVTVPVTPAPTPTPYVHIVKKDETMLGIAYQYGIKLEELEAANPTVDPHFMSIGTQLIIPIGGEIPEVIPTPTAMPVKSAEPRCYRAGDGGAWCIVALTNEFDISIENLSTWIGIYTLQGEAVSSQVAYAPLNILQPGGTIPLMAYFAPPLPENYTTRSEILSALPVAADDERYLDLEGKVQQIGISQDGKQAIIDGEVIIPGDTATPSQLWVLGVAYDLHGNVVGARKWKSDGQSHFNFTIYSLAGGIDHVEVLVEARP